MKITTDDQLNLALDRIEELWDKEDDDSRKEFIELVSAVEEYERQTWTDF